MERLSLDVAKTKFRLAFFGLETPEMPQKCVPILVD